jgi:hypothetical protein
MALELPHLPPACEEAPPPLPPSLAAVPAATAGATALAPGAACAIGAGGRSALDF